MPAGFKRFFHFPDELIYLNAAYMSPMPVASAQAGVDAITKRTNGFWEFTAQDFFETSEKLRALVARLWVTMPRNVALVPSVSYGVETAIKNIQLKPGSEILVPQDDFPSNIYPWGEAAKRTGATLAFVGRPENFDWTERFLERIRPGTSLVSVPLCDWSDGTRFDLKKISEACRRVGACFVVDVSQSFGAVPISVSEFDPDFMFSVGYKWQLGPYGLSYLYVAERWLHAEPLENNWLNRAGSDDFTRLVEYRDSYQDGARRFDAGERSQFHLTPMAVESMRLLNDLTIPAIYGHVHGLVLELHERLTELGMSLPKPGFLVGHMLGARHRNWPDMSPLVKRLKEKGANVSARGQAMRLSPHLYNSREDVLRFIELLSKELKHVDSRSFAQ